MLNSHSSIPTSEILTKPPKSLAPKHVSIASSQVLQDLQAIGKRNRGKRFPSEDETMTIADLVEKYASLIPLCFRITTGFLAENDKDPTIHYGDLCSVHLVKRAEYIAIQDKAGDKYKIPLYSAVKIGIKYANATSKVFNSVQDIMEASPLPKVVAAMGSYIGADSKSSVQKNEVLVIKKVKKSKFGHGKLSLKAFSVTFSTKKKLFRACNVKFTTKPKDTQLYVTDLLKHVPDLLPCKAHLFLDSENKSVSLPERLTRESVVLESKDTDTSIVISLVAEETKQQQREFIDLPTTLDVMGSVVSPEKVEGVYQDLYSQADSLAKDFDPTKLQPCVDARNDDTYMTQAALLAAIRKDHAKVGWEIQSSLSRPNQYTQPIASEKRTGVEDGDSSEVTGLPMTTSEKSFNPFSTSPILRPISEPLTPVEVSSYETKKPKPQPKPRSSRHGSLPKPEPIYVNSFNSNASWTPVPVASGNSCSVHRTQSERLPSHQIFHGAKSGPAYEDIDEMLAQTIAYQKRRDRPAVTLPLESTNQDAHMQNLVSKIRSQGKCPPIPAKKPVAAHRKLPIPTAQSSQETAKGKVFEQQLQDIVLVRAHERPVPPSKPRVPVRPISESDSVSPSKPEMPLSPLSREEHPQQMNPSKGTVECTPDSFHNDLTQLGPNEIVRLLEAMNLDKYKKAFMDEAIDGEIFGELDEDVLAEELGVTSRIHRLRLMKVISGKVSAKAVLDGSVVT